MSEPPSDATVVDDDAGDPAGAETLPAEGATPSEGREDAEALAPGGFVDRYELLRKLGAGGMGVVYEAHDSRLGRKVALKLLLELDGASERAHARLMREAQAMARLSHPNVATVHEVGAVDERVFLAMELIEGPSLRSWLGEDHDWTERLRMLVEAGEGLAAAHGAGLVHRDFKPANVMVGPDGRPRVLDFGLVRTAREVSEDREAAEDETRETLEDSSIGVAFALDENGDLLATPMTRTGALMGTPAYMAPEQFLGREVTERSDQFSFCVTLYEALYGERPFAARSIPELMVATTEGPRLPERGPIPRDLARILERGLSPKPQDRWPTMAELLEQLHAQLAKHANPDRDLAVGRRQRTALLIGFALLILLVAAAMEIFDPAKVLADPLVGLEIYAGLCGLGLAVLYAARRAVGRNLINRQMIAMVAVFQVGLLFDRVIGLPLELGWPEIYLIDLSGLCVVSLLGGALIHRWVYAISGFAAVGVALACFELSWAPQISLVVNVASLISLVVLWRGGSRDQSRAEALMARSGRSTSVSGLAGHHRLDEGSASSERSTRPR